MYLSPVYHALLPQYRSRFGYMHNIVDGGTSAAILNGHKWMLDNGAFTGKWKLDKWLSIMDKYASYRQNCIGVVVPDVVYDAAATLAQFEQYAPLVKVAGYPVALVTQNGMAVEDVPWPAVDVLFIGGDDEHKMSGAWHLIAEATRRGKWIHVGRVNSAQRIGIFWMADSWDGTTLAIEPSMHNQRLILNAATQATGKRNSPQLLETI